MQKSNFVCVWLWRSFVYECFCLLSCLHDWHCLPWDSLQIVWCRHTTVSYTLGWNDLLWLLRKMTICDWSLGTETHNSSSLYTLVVQLTEPAVSRCDVSQISSVELLLNLILIRSLLSPGYLFSLLTETKPLIIVVIYNSIILCRPEWILFESGFAQGFFLTFTKSSKSTS